VETKIANVDGKVDQNGHQATYPPGTKVFFQNGEYAGHVSPEVPEEEKPVKIQKKQIESKE